ncbi:MAG TPA: hypothetical protein VHA12_03360 [Candidatus Nanoarchaeia archaeon]|nr:hypothetical protein [Candidatus Nanoarchaeia archaeon]
MSSNEQLEKLFLFRHGDYNIDQKTRVQTLAEGYREKSEGLIKAIRSRLDFQRSIGLIASSEERTSLSVSHVAKELEVIGEEINEVGSLSGAYPNLAYEEIMQVTKLKPKSQYLVCGSQGNMSSTGVLYEVLRKLGKDKENIRSLMAARGGNYWSGFFINVRTGEWERI